MIPGKVALLLLLVFTVISPQQVACVCTEEQKDDILKHCKPFVSKNGSAGPPRYKSPCCKMVRIVPGRDIQCIIDILTAEEKEHNDVVKIGHLNQLCYPVLPFPQGMV
ncbi:hypothetical protein ACP70R_001847 [Stipagrostis hirtigluma subsp. patula]